MFRSDSARLEAWHKATTLTLLVRNLTRDFPGSGHPELGRELQAMSKSLASLVAEGSTATARIDSARCLTAANQVTLDLLARSTASRQQHLFSELEFSQLHERLEELLLVLGELRGPSGAS